ncbi:MAG: hypothetical protein IPK35_15160 [Saprospiraceae bacterium]|nr:hypothetical protein [Saprospiraceae bacterium]
MRLVVRASNTIRPGGSAFSDKSYCVQLCCSHHYGAKLKVIRRGGD